MVTNWRSNRSYGRNERLFVFSGSRAHSLHGSTRRKSELYLGLELILPFLSFLLFER
jgi:hypothetical protein